MHVYHLAEAHITQPTIVTIGVFDGVHRGHQQLIRQLVEHAHSDGKLAGVLTFFPHPDVVLRGVQGRHYLTTSEQRAALLLALGVDFVVTHPFDDHLRHIRAEAFVDQLRAQLKIEGLWIGADFALGYQREGNISFLQAQGARKGFNVQVMDLLMDHGSKVSSTFIREALAQGEIEHANEMLGRAYSISGEVIHGEKRGRQIGYPTANMDVWQEQVLPMNGIYAGWATMRGQRYMAMTNIGIRPTFSGQNITVEPYLLDFNEQIYGETISLSFDKFIRPEAKFDGLPALIAQIGEDVRVGRAWLSENARA
jgi:riboflavin kinase / FMN adenylyltransferase